MAHGGNALLHNLDIIQERKRLIDHLSKLFFSDLAAYTPRPVEKSIFGLFRYFFLLFFMFRKRRIRKLWFCIRQCLFLCIDRSKFYHIPFFRIFISFSEYTAIFFLRHPFDNDAMWLKLPLLFGKNPNDSTSTILNSIGKLTLLDICKLRPNNGRNSYLNSILIDAYLQYISDNFPYVAFLSSDLLSYFSRKTRSNRLPRSLNQDHLIGFKGILFIPMYMQNSDHWGILFANFCDKTLISMDSLNMNHHASSAINVFVDEARYLYRVYFRSLFLET